MLSTPNLVNNLRQIKDKYLNALSSLDFMITPQTVQDTVGMLLPTALGVLAWLPSISIG